MGVIKSLFGCAFVLLVVLQGATADTYQVLDKLGWIIPPAGNIAYRTWAAQQDFQVGDTLVFNFTTGQHDVAKVTKAEYDACTATSPILIEKNGPANMTLADGANYFICTFSSHCGLGQKLSINIGSSSDGSPGSSPNSASSVAVGAFTVALLSMAMALLF